MYKCFFVFKLKTRFNGIFIFPALLLTNKMPRYRRENHAMPLYISILAQSCLIHRWSTFKSPKQMTKEF